MLVGFDATPATQGAGVGRYSASLLRALLATEGDERYILLLSRDAYARLDVPASGRIARQAVLPVGERLAELAWHRLGLPLAAEWFTGAVDVFHAPNFLLPPLRRARGVVTVHDLSFLLLPQYAHPSLAAYLRRSVPRSLRRAEVVLADSRNTAVDIVGQLGLPSERVRVVYPGVARRFRPEAEPGERDRLAGRYGLDRSYLLCVGTIEPRKNYPGAVAGYTLLRRRRDFDGLLAIAGGTGWMAEESLAAARDAGPDVRLLGRVDEADLPALYRQAQALVYASHYEGFGLPPLEAMACGTPVVVARTSSLPEVVGEAGIYCGTDGESIAEGMARAVGDESLRQSLRKAGIERARRFTWEAAAEQVRRVYHELA